MLMPKFEDENYSHEGIHVLRPRRERAIAKFSNANNSLDHFDNSISNLDEREFRRAAGAAGAAVLKTTESQNEHRRSYERHQNEMKSMESIKMRSHKSKPILSGSKDLSISTGGEDSRNDQNSLSCDFDYEFDFEFDVTKVKSKPGDEDSFREIAMMMDSLDAMKLAGFTQTKAKAKAKTQTQTQITSSHKIEIVNKKIKTASPSQQESNNNVQDREVEVTSGALVRVPVVQAPSPSCIINDATIKRLAAIHCKLAKMNQQLRRSVDHRMKEVRMNMDEKLDHVHGEFDTILNMRCGTVACTRNVMSLS